MTNTLKQVYAPVLTPFTADLACDTAAFVDHCRWITDQGAGLAIFGTNSEAASLSLTEKRAMLAAVAEAGIDPNALMPGTGACAMDDAVELTRAAMDAGARHVLVLPPFFFKPVSEDGLVAWYSRLIDTVGANDLAIILYNIPQFTGVPITPALIKRLRQLFPEQIVGVKDSSGDRDSLADFLAIKDGFRVFPASEILLSETLAQGAAGCISATANVNAAAMVRAAQTGSAADFDQVKKVREAFQRRPMIPAMKAWLADEQARSDWVHVRPPLTPFAADERAGLLEDLQAVGFGRIV